MLRLVNGRKSDMNVREIHHEFNLLKDAYQDHTFIYTDGSKTAEGVGCAFLYMDTCQQFRLPDYCSVFTAEAFAILRALLFCELNRVDQCVICTDSLSVVTALQSSSTQHPTVIDIIETVHRLLSMSYRVVIVWIPGHCHIRGNDVVDDHARRALTLADVFDIPLGPREYFPMVRSAVRCLFETCWNDYRQTGLKMVKEHVGLWETSNRSSRREEIVLCRLRLGHTRYTHSYLLDREPPPTCTQCGCTLTIPHILLDCQRYTTERRLLQNSCRARGLRFSLKVLLGNEHADVLDDVYFS